MEPYLVITREGPGVTATLNCPGERNALIDVAYSNGIASFCNEICSDASIRVLILTGAGSAFCAGGNVKHMRDKIGMFSGSPYELRNRYRAGIQLIRTALYELEIPVVAAVNGPAIGAGLDLTCMCDIRIAAENAVFAESFVKLGLVPGDGGAWLLPRIIGISRASHLNLKFGSLFFDRSV